MSAKEIFSQDLKSDPDYLAHVAKATVKTEILRYTEPVFDYTYYGRVNVLEAKFWFQVED